VIDGLHPVDEGQDQVPNLLLVAVVEPGVDVEGGLVHENGGLDDQVRLPGSLLFWHREI